MRMTKSITNNNTLKFIVIFILLLLEYLMILTNLSSKLPEDDVGEVQKVICYVRVCPATSLFQSPRQVPVVKGYLV